MELVQGVDAILVQRCSKVLPVHGLDANSLQQVDNGFLRRCVSSHGWHAKHCAYAMGMAAMCTSAQCSSGMACVLRSDVGVVGRGRYAYTVCTQM